MKETNSDLNLNFAYNTCKKLCFLFLNYFYIVKYLYIQEYIHRKYEMQKTTQGCFFYNKTKRIT